MPNKRVLDSNKEMTKGKKLVVKIRIQGDVQIAAYCYCCSFK